MEFQQHIPLAPFTTLGIGGPARWFATARTEDDVIEAVRFAKDHAMPLFVLGGGSNLLVADSGFPGVVLRMAIPGTELESPPRGSSLLRVGAGEDWDALVQLAVERDLAGMECLAGIPGTVGGTPVQNVGAYGQEVAQTICNVRCFDRHTSAFAELPNEACGFAYRTSLFNTSARDRYIVTRVDFALTPGGLPKLSYADLRKYFAGKERPPLAAVADAVRSIRRAKSMVVDPSDPNSRSAGSFFQNPVVAEGVLADVARVAGAEAASVPHWDAENGRIKLPAAWLLEHAGFGKGYVLGRAGISTRHTLALINRGDCTAEEIESLRDRIIDTVRRLFGIQLQQEPVNVG